jgi:hypothetical protein
LRWQYAPNPSPNGRRVDVVALLGVTIEGGQAISECGWLDAGFVIREESALSSRTEPMVGSLLFQDT